MVKHSQLLLLFVALVGLRLPCVKALRHQYDQQSLKNHDNDSDLKPAAAHNSNADALHRVLDGEEPCAIQLSVCGAVLSALNAGCDVEDDVVATLTKLIQELLEAILGTDADQEMCPSLLDECLDMVGNFSCLASSGTASTTPSLTASTAPSITSAPAAGRIVTRAPVLPVTSLSPSSSSMPSQLPTMSAFPSTSQFPTFSEFPSTSQFPTISMFPSASQFPTVSEFPTEDIQCVTSEEELRLAIESSSEEPSFPTQIGICSNIVVTDAIILDRKAFDLFCAIEKTNCPLNAQNRNRIFFGAPAATSFRNIDFVNGDAEGEFGGGLHLIGDGSVDFIDSRFFNNRAERGGAMYIDGSSLSVAILNCLFQRNQATVQAGAIYFEDGNLLITESTFKENTAFSNGGVMYMKGGILNITNDSFLENIAVQSGGALFFDSVNSVAISGSAFIDNKSNSAALLTGGGGAIASFLGDITLTNTVFSGNSGSNGFDIWVEDDSDPVTGSGTFISCNDQVTFCNGINGYDEFGDHVHDSYSNSNCLETGIASFPGEGPCPE